MIDKLLDLLASIPRDKTLHSFYGTAIFILGLVVLAYPIDYLHDHLHWFQHHTDVKITIMCSYLLIVVIAFAKELYDRFSPVHTPDFMDIIFTILFPSLLTVYMLLVL